MCVRLLFCPACTQIATEFHGIVCFMFRFYFFPTPFGVFGSKDM